MVYPWISLDILGYSCLSEARFLGRPVLLVSFNVHTFVGDQQCFIARATLAIVPGGKVVHKRLTSSPSSPAPTPRLCRGRLGRGSFLFNRPQFVVVAVALAAVAASDVEAAAAAAAASGGGGGSQFELAMGNIGLSCHQKGNQLASSKGIASPNIHYHYTAGVGIMLIQLSVRIEFHVGIPTVWYSNPPILKLN